MNKNTKYEKMILREIKHVPQENQSLLLKLVKLYSIQSETANVNTLENVLSKLQVRGVFKKIKKPVAWQRKLRNEW